jgi:hypothetical protein
MSQSQIVEIFGKFAVELEDGPKLFNTREEAAAAETSFLKGAEFRAEAAGFNAYAGNEGKNAKGKQNVITAYLEWVALGRPVKEEEEVAEAAEVAETADVATSTDEDVLDF